MSEIHDRARKRKLKVKRRVKTTEKQLLKAIKDTGGSIRIIAQRLDRPYRSVWGLIQNSPDAREAIRIEQERVADIAEETIAEMMMQRVDFGTASRTARWLLERKHIERGYKPTKELTVQGGDNPLKVQSEKVLSLDELKSIPLEVRKRMLEEMQEDTSGK